MRARLRYFWLLLGSTSFFGCSGTTAKPTDGGTDGREKRADAAVDSTSDDSGDTGLDAGDGACVTPGIDDGFCTFCQNRWYCYGSPPYMTCPDDGGGSCSADAEPCFLCSEHVEGYVCYCEASDGGDPEAGLTWGCQSNESGCGT